MKSLYQLLLSSLILLSIGCQTSVKESNNIQDVKGSKENIQSVVYKIPEMESVIIEENIVYKTHGDSTLNLDLYRPPSKEQFLPVIVFVSGFRTDVFKITKYGQYISWAKLLAASGFIAVTYETLDQKTDLEDLISFLREKGNSLNIDKDQIGLWMCSGNTPTGLTYILENNMDYIKCGVIYYGLILIEGWDHLDYWDSVLADRSVMSPRVNLESEIKTNTSILIVRAGLEHYPYINEGIDRFLLKANENNLLITFVNYPEGRHGFDIKDDNDNSRDIIKFTIDYFNRHLKTEQ